MGERRRPHPGVRGDGGLGGPPYVPLGQGAPPAMSLSLFKILGSKGLRMLTPKVFNPRAVKPHMLNHMFPSAKVRPPPGA